MSTTRASTRRAPGRRRAERWAFPVAWVLLPFVAGPAFAASLDSRSPGVRSADSVALWLIWGVTLGAALIPRTVTLTTIRIVAPAGMVAAVWAAAANPDPGWADAVALAFTAVVTAVALSPGTGDAFANGSSYGAERRFPLRAPGALLLGPIELAWAVAVAGAVTGPMLLAAQQWVARRRCSRSWDGPWPGRGADPARAVAPLAGVHPAGVVVHDPMVVVEAMLVLRRHLATMRPAPADTRARDLTMGSPGVALEIDLTEPLPITPTPARRPAASSAARRIPGRGRGAGHAQPTRRRPAGGGRPSAPGVAGLRRLSRASSEPWYRIPATMSRTRGLLRPRVHPAAGPTSHKENTMAKYLLLKHYRGAPAPVNDVPMDQWKPDEVEAHIQFMNDFAARLEGSGEFIDGQALSPDGVWVRYDGEGRPPVTDGPFAETKDLIAGWMVIDVDSYERAIELAGELSAAPGAGGEPIHEWLEVRPFLAAPPTVTQ